jgi:hypothetical protein
VTSPEQRLPETEAVLAEAMKIGEAPAKPKRKAPARKTGKAKPA